MVFFQKIDAKYFLLKRNLFNSFYNQKIGARFEHFSLSGNDIKSSHIFAASKKYDERLLPQKNPCNVFNSLDFKFENSKEAFKVTF